ncbi:MAG: nucleotide pyrophosphohydrolase [Candidatus Pacebacteria bacterium]|nr:nucleotide pyrophosphohydrolase [Candidatus Paceibacterota bacterium]
MTGKKAYSSDLNQMMQAVLKITQERDWAQYHTPKNMAADLVREGSEVLEHFIWPTNKEILADSSRLQEIADQIGDVLHALLLLADACNIDLAKISKSKTKISSRLS